MNAKYHLNGILLRNSRCTLLDGVQMFEVLKHTSPSKVACSYAFNLCLTGNTFELVLLHDSQYGYHLIRL